ncbi:MAG: Abi family protein [Pseudorhodoplanes sp.]|nr:Abi family protein [Pseudorhodoplanes sp.]
METFFSSLLKHFYTHYREPYPPCWMIFEAISFGVVSHVYKRSKGDLRTPVAAQFGLHHDILESWLHSLIVARNVCAHSGRTWNRRFFKPVIPKMYAQHWPVESQDQLYVLCGMVHHLMKIIADGSNWSVRLRELINARPNVPLADMGFPEQWETSAFWEF